MSDLPEYDPEEELPVHPSQAPTAHHPSSGGGGYEDLGTITDEGVLVLDHGTGATKRVNLNLTADLIINAETQGLAGGEQLMFLLFVDGVDIHTVTFDTASFGGDSVTNNAGFNPNQEAINIYQFVYDKTADKWFACGGLQAAFGIAVF